MSFLGIGGGNNGQGVPGLGNVSAQQISLDPQDLQNQQAFVKALQTQAAGGGPSVANQALQNATQQNAAATSAQIGASRGVNPGLALRQGLLANTQANQAAAGQAAQGRMQEQLNAQGLLGNQVNNMQEQALGAQRANQQADLGAQSLNVSQAQQVASNQAGVVGGVAKGLGSALAMGLAEGGMVPPVKMAAGGITPVASMSVGDPSSAVGQYLKGIDHSGDVLANDIGGAFPGKKSGGGDTSTPMTDAGYKMPELGAGQFGGQPPSLMGGAPAAGPSLGVGDLASSLGPMALAQGGRVPAMVSPGERYLPPKAVAQVAEGKKSPMKAGEKIPGKPAVGGAKNSYANDTVPKTLEAGGIVLPRSVTQAKDAPEKAAAFVRAVLAKQNLRKK